MLPKYTESSLVTACLGWLQCLENSKKIAYVDRCNSGTVFAKGRRIRLHREGFPDILVIGNRRMVHSVFIFIECKVGSNKLSLEQNKFKNMIEENGHLYWLIRSLDELTNNFKNIGIS